MEIIITSLKFKARKKLETFIREKVRKLFHHDNKIIRANVVLRETENGNPENKLCEIRLVIPGNDHFVSKCTGMYEKSVLQAVGVLQNHLRRAKNKLIAKRYFQKPVP